MNGRFPDDFGAISETVHHFLVALHLMTDISLTKVLKEKRVPKMEAETATTKGMIELRHENSKKELWIPFKKALFAMHDLQGFTFFLRIQC